MRAVCWLCHWLSVWWLEGLDLCSDLFHTKKQCEFWNWSASGLCDPGQGRAVAQLRCLVHLHPSVVCLQGQGLFLLGQQGVCPTLEWSPPFPGVVGSCSIPLWTASLMGTISAHLRSFCAAGNSISPPESRRGAGRASLHLETAAKTAQTLPFLRWVLSSN